MSARQMSDVERLRWWSNTVRPLKSASLVDRATAEVSLGSMTVELHRGAASLGHQSGFERIESWWTVIYVVHEGRRYGRGSRFTGKRAQQRAESDFAESVVVQREAGR